MKKTLLIVYFFGFFAFSQNPSDLSFYKEIPEAFLSHPELMSSKHQTNFQESKYELVHLRTKFSKTFLNTNQTRTTIQSTEPLHYMDAQGFWLSEDYKISKRENLWVYPTHEPIMRFDSDQKTLSFTQGDYSLNLDNTSEFIFLDENNQNVTTVASKNVKPAIVSDNALVFKDYLPHIDKQLTFYNKAIKSDFIIKNKQAFPNNFNRLVIEELIVLPRGFSVVKVLNKKNEVHQLDIIDARGQHAFSYNQPIVTDAKPIDPKFRDSFVPFEGVYDVVQVSENSFKIQLIIDAHWLLSEDRFFPVTIDPVITNVSTAIVNACFTPAYQQSTLQVEVPAGQTVFYTDISYDFVAVSGSQAWMSDQRSFVSGPNGQTAVFQGIGDTSGLYTYDILNSDIANIESSGNINFTFNFSRIWGGSGCNATFQLVNRREVSVTYGTIVYGDGPVFINEYSASNRSFNDSFGRTEDWVELYNASPDTYFNLSGFHLSNDSANPTLWQIQNGVIPPNSRVLVFCSSRNTSSGTVMHANFGLTQLRPDQIVLADPDGNVIESLEMFTTQTNHSYGRTTDGADTWQVFATPTPGSANSGGFDHYTSKPAFSIEAGNYPSAVTISLTSSGDNEEIRYTTDGSTPTETSTLYTSAFTVSETTAIRARAFSSNPSILPGFIETNTYFINENSSLPIFSFAGDADLMQLFNGNQTLEPLANFEYFGSDGVFIDENLGDFDKHGNDSWNYPQRGVDFVSRDDHGYKRRLEHQFFATSDRTRFRRLMVKAAASDNYPFENGGAHLRDAFIQTLSQLSGLALDERSATFVSVFVNGQYWGVYDLRERVDDNNYTDYYYNQDYTFRDSDVYLQFLKTWGGTQAHFGNQPAINDWQSLRQYVQNNDMGVDTNFDFVDSQLDIDSFIDYFVMNSFVVSRDWLNYNTGWWRGLDPNGQAQKWRYILWDMDAALGHYTNFTGLPNVTALAPPCQVENLTVGNGHTQILSKLIQENASARQKYVTRYADLLNTHFSTERVTQVFDSLVAVIAPEMPRQIQRWGGNINTWQNNVQTARNFLINRTQYLMNEGLANCYNLSGPFATTFQVVPENAGQIKMNSEWLTNYPFEAQVFGNIETILEVSENPGYVFSHWVVDGAVILPEDTNPNIVLQLSQATSVTAFYTDLINTDDELIYYWHFNNLQTPEDVTTIAADFSLIAEAQPMMTYTGSGDRDIDANNNGSDINLHQDEMAGRCARVRNPSEGRTLDFDLPTTGYRDITFAYAVERTNQGQLTNIISYSIDGINFIQTDLPETIFDIATNFSFIALDFSTIEAVNNNPDFKIRIAFEGNTVASNGNNRFDNITLKGVEDPSLTVIPLEKTMLQVFPNPFTSDIQIIATELIQEVAIFDLLGKNVWQQSNVNQNQTVIDLNQLSQGVYLLRISSDSGVQTKKIIKNR